MLLNIQDRKLLQKLMLSYEGTIDGIRVAKLVAERCNLTPEEIEKSGMGNIYECTKCGARMHVKELDDKPVACWVDGCDSVRVGHYEQPIPTNNIVADIDITETGLEILKKKLKKMSDGEALDMSYARLIELVFGEEEAEAKQNENEKG